jgi:phosphoribosylaminoimidazolecarboxamide formyltransferase/IMP cyclohydrolase
MLLAWKVACLSKSNAVAMVKDGAAVGIGMGFCSRVFAVEFAASQAGDKAKGAVMASDAFFPFADGLEKAAEAGIVAIIQPGGSVRDDEVKARAEELGISMFLSGWRTFRH